MIDGKFVAPQALATQLPSEASGEAQESGMPNAGEFHHSVSNFGKSPTLPCAECVHQLQDGRNLRKW